MKYFKDADFNCPCCKENHMDMEFLEMLETARVFADTPFIINSAWRCEKHNKKAGGKPESSHLTGRAVDIKADTSRKRFWVLYGLINAGFTRIGIGKTFIHADTDHNKDQEVAWLY